MNVYSRLIIDGTAVYEIDEECMKRREEQGETPKGGGEQQKGKPSSGYREKK